MVAQSPYPAPLITLLTVKLYLKQDIFSYIANSLSCCKLFKRHHFLLARDPALNNITNGEIYMILSKTDSKFQNQVLKNIQQCSTLSIKKIDPPPLKNTSASLESYRNHMESYRHDNISFYPTCMKPSVYNHLIPRSKRFPTELTSIWSSIRVYPFMFS